MTDYEKDLKEYLSQSRESYLNGGVKAPDPNDYDENGYKKGSVTYEDGLVLDNYLVNLYGIEYARKNPLKKL